MVCTPPLMVTVAVLRLVKVQAHGQQNHQQGTPQSEYRQAGNANVVAQLVEEGKEKVRVQDRLLRSPEQERMERFRR
jgi:hypothetical protein